MQITKNEFLVLRTLYDNSDMTQRELKEETHISLGSVNNALQNLREQGFLDSKDQVTSNGEDELEKYRVDNAVIMAAGMSSRFAPLSYENPKGLLEVKGEILIERQIRQLHEVGIKDITVVLGYMKEKFFYLEEKYGVKLVINEDYYRYNNTSTLILVLNKLKNTYLCSSDNYLVENIFNTYEYEGFYPVVEGMPDEPGEYYATFNNNGTITDLKIGEGKYCLLGPVYFDTQFSKEFSKLLEKEYSNVQVRENLWELLYLNNFKKFDLKAKIFSNKVILEFDSLSELQNFDTYYLTNTDSTIFKNIMKTLKCELKDITNIETIKAGLTNLSFSFDVDGVKYIYRHPGVGTQEYIDRKSEEFAQNIAKENELDNTFIYMDKDSGWKLSYFIEDVRLLDYHNDRDVTQALKVLKKLHNLEITEGVTFDIWKKNEEFIASIKDKGRHDFEEFDILYRNMKKLFNILEQDNIPKILCHNDFYDPNILFKDGACYLIDWEYAGLNDPAGDLGTFIACSDYTFEEAMEVIQQYKGRELTQQEKAHFLGYIAVMSYYWFLWAIFQESNGSLIGEYLYLWFKYSKEYGTVALELYGDKYENN